MKRFLAAMIYTGLVLIANPASADMSAIENLRDGDMKKLIFASAPTDIPATEIMDANGQAFSLEKYKGNYVVLNFWATWCAPCRKEMPTLSNLATQMEGKPVKVVTLATGRNSPAGITKFFDEIGVDNLPKYQDPKQKLARGMAVLGLPITVILDPEGREIARLRGDADWDSDSAIAIMTALAGESS